MLEGLQRCFFTRFKSGASCPGFKFCVPQNTLCLQARYSVMVRAMLLQLLFNVLQHTCSTCIVIYMVVVTAGYFAPIPHMFRQSHICLQVLHIFSAVLHFVRQRCIGFANAGALGYVEQLRCFSMYAAENMGAHCKMCVLMRDSVILSQSEATPTRTESVCTI